MANETRKGGLGRGLAALIPDGSAKPRLGNNAASIVLGESSRERDAAAKQGGRASQGGSQGARGHGSNGQSGKGQGRQRSQKGVQRSRPENIHEDYSTPMGATYREIPIGLIEPNEKQPREVFDEQAMAELTHSIKEFGLMQPIVVREVADGYELIMGERRWRAATKAGMQEIPAIVRETEDSTMLRDALLENIHRVQLNPLEEAAAYQQLLEEFGVTQAELADKLGRSRPVITNMIRLLALPVSVQRTVAAGVLSAGHARALLGVKVGEEAQEKLAKRIVAEGLSVRATEEAVTLLNRGGNAEKTPPREKAPQPEYLTHAAESLADSLDTKVTVQAGKKKGKIIVEFAGREDFERIVELLER
ncbi:ParB/RepB/Spo0J family partition protein [Corynebacterium sp. TAE3-ERU2]|uniref:ParB/RepB/Spo0J family partition protein n=1 Tax=Corynebacterium sp. TAE3-ERU2 TaxID=2849497 RepID=UPI001C44FBA6|nr:ParB/RepB/Spo0J family partition protein [Corynebacterium sp. TAE3-ERU2]MBV7302318.1 ParB/RepB/Spo0J family partition protein [Corynebacterium sp. TAE3-ERU2]